LRWVRSKCTAEFRSRCITSMIFGPRWVEDSLGRVLALARLFGDALFSPFLASKFFQIQLQAHLQNCCRTLHCNLQALEVGAVATLQFQSQFSPPSLGIYNVLDLLQSSFGLHASMWTFAQRSRPTPLPFMHLSMNRYKRT
jgi:hypothetical protein